MQNPFRKLILELLDGHRFEADIAMIEQVSFEQETFLSRITISFRVPRVEASRWDGAWTDEDPQELPNGSSALRSGEEPTAG